MGREEGGGFRMGFLAWAKLDLMGQWRPARRKREEENGAILETNPIPAFVELMILQGR